MHSRKKQASFLAVVAALIAAAAFTADASARTDGTSAQSVTIGWLGPASGGPAVDLPSNLAAARAWTRAINAQGGLARKFQVNLDVCNTKNDPNLTVACAQRFVSEHAVAVIGSDPATDGVSMAILDAAHIPDIGNFPSAPISFSSPYSYPVDQGGFLGFFPISAYVGRKLHESVAFVGVDIPASHQNGALLMDATKAAVHWTGATYVPFTTADYGPIVASAAQGHPQAVALFTGAAQGAAFVRAAEASNAGFKTYIWGTADKPSLASIPRDAWPKIVFSTVVKPVSVLSRAHNKLFAQFVKDMQAEYRSGDTDASLTSIVATSFNPFLAGTALQQVLAHATSITPQTIKAALDRARNINMGNITAPWTPSNPGPSGFERVSNTKMFLWHYTTAGAQVLFEKQPVTPAEAIAGR